MIRALYNSLVNKAGKRSGTSIDEVVFFAALTVLVLNAVRHILFTIDDAYITYSYAKNIALGNGAVFSSGSNVEATSSFIWALLLVPFESLIPNGSILGSKLLGLGALLCIFVVCMKTFKLLSEERTGLWFVLAMMASASATTVWAVYGLETGFYGMLVIFSIYYHLREIEAEMSYTYAVLVSMVCITRPEGFVLASVFIALKYYASTRSSSVLHGVSAMKKLWLGLVIIVAYKATTFYLFGSLIPNTYYAKAGYLDWNKIARGLRYIASPYAVAYTAALGMAWFLIMKAAWKNGLSLLLLKRIDLKLISLIGIVIAQYAFIIIVGGDWMTNARFLAPIVPLIILLLAYALVLRSNAQICKIGSTRRSLGIYVVVALFFLCFNVVIDQRVYLYQQSLEHSEENALTKMACYLNSIDKQGKEVVACSDIGRLGYYYNGTVLDWWGLADVEIARNGMSLGRIDPDVVFSRKPKYIVLISDAPYLNEETLKAPMSRFSRKFVRHPDFRKYRKRTSFMFWENRWHVLLERS